MVFVFAFFITETNVVPYAESPAQSCFFGMAPTIIGDADQALIICDENRSTPGSCCLA
jgi:hypothetical protein